MSKLKRLDLLLKEVSDPYAQDNFWRLKKWIEENFEQKEIVTTSGGGSGGSGSGGGGGSSITFITKVSVIIPAGATVAVDTVALASFKTLDYVMSFVGSTKTRSLKLLLCNAETDLEDQVYARGGDSLSLQLSASIVGLNARLSVTNNEAFSIVLTFVKTTL